MPHKAQDTDAIDTFQSWFRSRGGWYHPNVVFGDDSNTGLSLFAKADIPADSTVVRMPKRLALTPQACREKIVSTFADVEAGENGLPNFKLPADWVVFYLFLVRSLVGELGTDDATQQESAERGAKRQKTSDSASDFLSHVPYVRMLPEAISTPVEFNEAEQSMLRATPLHGDAIERQKRFHASFVEAVSWLNGRIAEGPSRASARIIEAAKEWSAKQGSSDKGISAWSELSPAFKTWIWAQSAYSSRAFPPAMVAADGSLRRLSGPVLLPGMDAFNHARGVPVTWSYPCLAIDTSDEEALAAPAQSVSVRTARPARKEALGSEDGGLGDGDTHVALTLRYKVKKGEQVFNCYGGKSNEEFLAGYGFVLPDGLDDTLTLALGGGGSSNEAGKAEDAAVGQQDSSAQGDGGAAQPVLEIPTDTALSLRKTWGQKHYWRLQHPASPLEHGGAPAGLLFELRERLLQAVPSGGDEEADSAAAAEEPPSLHESYLLKPFVATPGSSAPPTPPLSEPTGSSSQKSQKKLAQRSHRRKKEAQLSAWQLDGEILETLEEMLCAKRAAFRSVQKEIDAQAADAQSKDQDKDVRAHVREMIEVYRRGQGTILDQAIDWTREKMDELVELIEKLEEELDGAQRGE